MHYRSLLVASYSKQRVAYYTWLGGWTVDTTMARIDFHRRMLTTPSRVWSCHIKFFRTTNCKQIQNMPRPSVSSPVRLFVSRRLNISSNFFHTPAIPSVYFSRPNIMAKFQYRCFSCTICSSYFCCKYRRKTCSERTLRIVTVRHAL